MPSASIVCFSLLKWRKNHVNELLKVRIANDCLNETRYNKCQNATNSDSGVKWNCGNAVSHSNFRTTTKVGSSKTASKRFRVCRSKRSKWFDNKSRIFPNVFHSIKCSVRHFSVYRIYYLFAFVPPNGHISLVMNLLPKFSSKSSNAMILLISSVVLAIFIYFFLFFSVTVIRFILFLLCSAQYSFSHGYVRVRRYEGVKKDKPRK